MISAFCGAGAFLLVGYTQIVRPRWRLYKLKRPFNAYFLITSINRFHLSYVLQDDDEHFVKHLVVPANAEIDIQIALEPKLSFTQQELYFGCDEHVLDSNKPRATEYFVPFILEGVRRSGKPDKDNPGHYMDYNGFYHVRENFLYTEDVRIIGFKLRTKGPGVYSAQVFTVCDGVRGKSDLMIRVEQPLKTKMRFFLKAHREAVLLRPLGA
jgi:hypothetical protein